MTTILITILLSFAISIFITPLVGKLGIYLNAIDMPGSRKVHKTSIPRIGGMSIFISFFLSILISSTLSTTVSSLIQYYKDIYLIVFGALLCFGIGLFDDFKKLGPAIKALFQLLAATSAYFGGLQILNTSPFSLEFHFGPLSFIVTVMWFMLLINAVNLIDGLDGLATGIVFFTSIIMVILTVIRKDYFTGLLFGALGGGTLGFLRYNFNPASIFLGDGGSYFLGYCIAAFSIMGSAKSQVSVAMMIPALAMGVPLFDAIFAPVRRWLRGQKMFQPDDEHVHHRLISKGLTTRKAVVIVYGISVFLCVIALFLVNIRDERAGLFLIVLGAAAVVFVRKLGYFEYVGADKLLGWFLDITDDVGISRSRRTFLSRQIDIAQSPTLTHMWEEVTLALIMLDFDYAAFYAANSEGGGNTGKNPLAAGCGPESPCEVPGYNRHAEPAWEWKGNGVEKPERQWSDSLFKIELPLTSEQHTYFGLLVLIKDVEKGNLSHFTLRRVEHLRRAIIQGLVKFHQMESVNLKGP